jgi:hypothetical protein
LFVADEEQLKSLLSAVVLALCVGAGFLLFKIFASDGASDIIGLESSESSKAFQTAIGVAFISLAVGAGANLIARQPEIAAVGYLTIIVGIVALLLFANQVWLGSIIQETTNSDRWAWYTLIGTVALGIASTLLAGHDDGDEDSVKLVRGMTVFALFGLLVAVIREVSVSGERVDPTLLGSLSVFFVLGCLVLPLLSRITR